MTKTFRVLLAEDDEDDRLFFEQSFTADNAVAVTACENGVALLRQLRGLRFNEALPDVIVLDQNMPKLNGLETLQLLKADEKFSPIPAIIYSTYADERLREKGTRDGALLVLEKPFDKPGYEKMLSAIRAAVRK